MPLLDGIHSEPIRSAATLRLDRDENVVRGSLRRAHISECRATPRVQRLATAAPRGELLTARRWEVAAGEVASRRPQRAVKNPRSRSQAQCRRQCFRWTRRRYPLPRSTGTRCHRGSTGKGGEVGCFGRPTRGPRERDGNALPAIDHRDETGFERERYRSRSNWRVAPERNAAVSGRTSVNAARTWCERALSESNLQPIHRREINEVHCRSDALGGCLRMARGGAAVSTCAPEPCRAGNA